jgi:hypothetical protein
MFPEMGGWGIEYVCHTERSSCYTYVKYIIEDPNVNNHQEINVRSHPQYA